MPFVLNYSPYSSVRPEKNVIKEFLHLIKFRLIPLWFLSRKRNYGKLTTDGGKCIRLRCNKDRVPQIPDMFR